MGIREALLNFHEEKGIKKGEERGIKKGEERGIEKGEERGMEKTLQIIKLLKEKKSIAEIADKLDVSSDFVEKIKAEIKH